MMADKKQVTRLLKTARGQIDGILKMVEEDRYCIDISHQIMASEAILKRANKEVLKAHMTHCVHDAVNSEDCDQKIEEMINKKLYVKDVSMDDIFDSYYLNYVDLNSEKCKFVLIEPIISEELKMYYDANNPTKIIKCSSDITGIDVLNMVNYNANIFDILPFYTKGIYNDNALNLINEYSKIKKDIYDKIFSIGLKSVDINEMINNLISKLCAYKNYGFLDEKLKNSKIFKDISNDLLVMMFGYSKIETTISRTITTSVDNIYEEFFNYLLMDFNIVQIPKLMYDEKNNDFIFSFPSLLDIGSNREAKEEISKIKKYVPYEERYLFFR